jgi:poly(3-hydroxybutyrate) depolymerase
MIQCECNTEHGGRLIGWLTWLAFCAFAMTTNPSAAAAVSCDTEMRAGVNHITVLSGGQEQSIDIVLPSSFKPGMRMPLVIGLHPSGGTGEGLDRDTGLRSAATAKGFAVMLPDGVTRVRYGACRGGSEVVLYRIDAPRDQGGGHVWPGGHRDLETRAQPPSGSTGGGAGGQPVVELDATRVVLEFFARH